MWNPHAKWDDILRNKKLGANIFLPNQQDNMIHWVMKQIHPSTLTSPHLLDGRDAWDWCVLAKYQHPHSTLATSLATQPGDLPSFRFSKWERERVSFSKWDLCWYLTLFIWPLITSQRMSFHVFSVVYNQKRLTTCCCFLCDHDIKKCLLVTQPLPCLVYFYLTFGFMLRRKYG